MPHLKAILTALLLAALINPFCDCLTEEGHLWQGTAVSDPCSHDDHPSPLDEDPHHDCAHSDARAGENPISVTGPQPLASVSFFDRGPGAIRIDSQSLSGPVIDPSPPPSPGPIRPAQTGVFLL